MKKHTALHKQDDEQYEVPIQEAIELARSHHIAGNYVLAERTYHDVLLADPEHPTANHLLGALYYQLTDIEKALQYMKRSVEIEPNEKQYWSNYGSVFYMAARHDEALECYDKALVIDPKHLETLNRKSLALWKKESFTEAAAVARESLVVKPDNLDGFVNLGLSLTKLGEFDEANNIWKKASEIFPQDVRILSNWANMLREINEHKSALDVAKKAVEISPNDIDALNNLGCILREMGYGEEAIENFRAATNASPKYYQAHYNMSLGYYDLAQYEASAIAARYAIDFKNDYAPAYNALSSALVEIGDFNQAHFAAQKAVQLSPDSAESYINLADVLYFSNNFDDGHAALKKALKLQPDDARVYAKLSNIYERLDEVFDALWAIDKAIELAPDVPIYIARKAAILHVANEIDQALECVDKSIELNPQMMPALITKAEILIALNRLDEANAVLDLAVEVDPNHPLIYFTKTNIRKYKSEDDPDLVNMLALREEMAKMGTSYMSSINYSISRVYEQLKKYDVAFPYLKEANDIKRKTVPYDIKEQCKMFSSMKENFTPSIMKQFEGHGYETDRPVFIVGMPRSGTTLTEQIISSHPDVFGAGELPDVVRAKRRMSNLNKENLIEAGKIYDELSSVRDKSGVAKRITDKMPGNYMHIGLISIMLPHAKIIHCKRSPMDTCLSNYKQNFMVGQYWSYDLEEMADEYLRYLDLMAYWREVLPGKFLEINYEDTVTDLEGQARKMIDYIGLEWNEACLEPHKQKRAILTASKGQVTQPVYKSSVEKWKIYEEQLQPLYEKLKDHI